MLWANNKSVVLPAQFNTYFTSESISHRNLFLVFSFDLWALSFHSLCVPEFGIAKVSPLTEMTRVEEQIGWYFVYKSGSVLGWAVRVLFCVVWTLCCSYGCINYTQQEFNNVISHYIILPIQREPVHSLTFVKNYCFLSFLTFYPFTYSFFSVRRCI